MYKRLYLDLTEPLPFYKVIDELAQTRSYFRYYIQNINYVKRLLSNLNTKIVRLYNRVN
jgi:hypothetical protein